MADLSIHEHVCDNCGSNALHLSTEVSGASVCSSRRVLAFGRDVVYRKRDGELEQVADG